MWAPACGRAVQVDPGFTRLTLHVVSSFQRLKLIYDEPLSSFAFNCKLRHYAVGGGAAPAVWRATAGPCDYHLLGHLVILTKSTCHFVVIHTNRG